MLPKLSLLGRMGRFAFAAALVAPVVLIATPQARALDFGISISVGTPPPPLPVYVQPPLPSPGYIWTPGYWAWGPAGYFWVPGTWVQPPQAGLLWTPGYWGFAGGNYGWHPGYWGTHVGFYGGVNYGFGYGGVGFFGGEWRGGSFFYNSAAANFGSTHITNVYVNKTVIQNNTIINNTHVSYNGGNGGINRLPTVQEQQFAQGQHFAPTQNQLQHQQFAAQDRGQLAAVNGGRPQTFATTNNAAYHQLAQQHMQQQPISQQDRQFGRSFNTAALNRGGNNPGPANQFGARQANQDQRIANGLRSGQMTSGEAAQANRAQAGIDQQVRTDRQANGGYLTQQQRQGINQQQNGLSRQIYNDNHNANTIRPNFVDNREANQDQRMANGIRSGQMNNGEAMRMQQRQGNIDQQVHNDRQFNGGRMNQPQRQQVQREQNHAGQQIRQDNHNERRR